MQATGVGAEGRMRENVRKKNQEKDKVQRMNSYWTLPLLLKTAWGLVSFLEGASVVSSPLDSDSLITNHFTADLLREALSLQQKYTADFRVCWPNKYLHEFRSRVEAFIVFCCTCAPLYYSLNKFGLYQKIPRRPQKGKSVQGMFLR